MENEFYSHLNDPISVKVAEQVTEEIAASQTENSGKL